MWQMGWNLRTWDCVRTIRDKQETICSNNPRLWVLCWIGIGLSYCIRCNKILSILYRHVSSQIYTACSFYHQLHLRVPNIWTFEQWPKPWLLRDGNKPMQGCPLPNQRKVIRVLNVAHVSTDINESNLPYFKRDFLHSFQVKQNIIWWKFLEFNSSSNIFQPYFSGPWP